MHELNPDLVGDIGGAVGRYLSMTTSGVRLWVERGEMKVVSINSSDTALSDEPATLDIYLMG